MAERSRWTTEPFVVDEPALRRLHSLLGECVLEIEKQIRENVEADYRARVAKGDAGDEFLCKWHDEALAFKLRFNTIKYALIMSDRTKSNSTG